MIFGAAVLLSTTVSFIPYALAWDTQKNTVSTDEVKNTSSKINIVNQCHNNAVCIAQVIQNYCSITNDPTTCGQAGEPLKLSKGPQGEQGPKGAKGETGEQGPQGPLASITGTLLIKIRVDNTKGGILTASDFS
ncbi:MAG TPA: collagen-like protein, partial [Nitrososphaeraceae archaeon]|nr:collagen-like protein [Nitrososphaeraceae archaeon]